MIAAIQTHSQLLHWHLHLHVLGFPYRRIDVGDGNYYAVLQPSRSPAARTTGWNS
jgi:hypothetical protein